MAFDQAQRNRLQRLVADARSLLVEEFTRQLQAVYGIDPLGGKEAALESLKGLGDEELEIARLLRETIAHYRAGSPSGSPVDAIDRVIREQSFTVLNRLCALCMAEARGLLVECVAKGPRSSGFQMYARLAGGALGEQMDAYRLYLFGVFDELALDLAVLFDRHSPFGRLFPRSEVLDKLLSLLADEELDSFWSEDETIGWIYQYFNSKEERKAMREQSSAPRNSRELAVRNQFFTPRYVVEFLTDNTLGRIWYEMTQGETKLKEQCRYLVRRPNEIFLQPGEAAPEQPIQDKLSQEDLLKQLVHIPHRPLKDPRTILMLDPACGSMHFGLYAFDLFEVIYDEAWMLEEKLGAEVLSRPPGMKSLHATYAGKDAFLKDVPRLIIEHNLHGIDIDPRCAQIAGLSLWLRAQKAWQRLGLKPAERPAIKRSNIVCAEPMPGEKELLREFVEREFPAAERAVCLRLLEAIFDKMQLAGEAGSLLKIEEEIRSAIEDARDAWQKLVAKPLELFTATELNQISNVPELTGLGQAVYSLSTDPRHLATDFWERIEERIYTALRDYSEQAEIGSGFQRRLFAEDAARGFAFIDVCRKRYDATVMNPPFGEFSLQFRDIAAQQFLGGSNDIITAFVERGVQLTAANGLEGVISSRTVFFAPTSAKWRQELIVPRGVVAWVELGEGVLDGAMVEVCMYVVGGSPSAHTLFTRPKSANGEFCLTDLTTSSGNLVFPVKLETFRALTGWPFAYWLDGRLFWCLENFPSLERTGTKVRVGLQTGDDFRFIRQWAEVPGCGLASPDDWLAHAKGGDNSPYYTDIHLVVNWKHQGREVKAQPSVRLNMYSGANPDLYLTPGMTFSYRTNRFSPAALPANCITGVAGMGIFAPVGDLPCLLAFLNSSAVNEFISARLGLLEINALYQAGTIQPTPVPDFTDAERSHLAKVGTRLSIVTGEILLLSETSRFFVSCGSAQTSLRELDGSRSSRLAKATQDVLKLFDDVEAIVFNAYQFGQKTSEFISSAGKEEMKCSLESLFEDALPKVGDVLSFAIGVTFGRWDIRYATGEQAAPDFPDPFAPLPVCPPGQLQNAQGLPARPEDLPAAYPVRIPWDGILVDDPNHPLDIERRVREVIEIIWSGQAGGPTAETIEHEACEILGVKSLRDYFRKPAGFFADHLKRYSKSRRQAPIYWPLSTASGIYTLWIYYHRLTDQTLYTCVNNFVDPKIEEVARQILTLKADKKTAALAEAQDFLTELENFKRELLEWAPKWKPNLNDGVLITASPLYKLFRLPKWRKDLEACWKALEHGDYDWAHLALSLWPERVRKVCVTDKSIAIAHGLEGLYVEPVGAAKKKRAKKVVEEPELAEEEE